MDHFKDALSEKKKKSYIFEQYAYFFAYSELLMFVLFLILQFLNNATLPGFLERLSNVTANLTTEVTGSPADISAIVEILSNVANSSLALFIPITETSMEVKSLC